MNEINSQNMLQVGTILHGTYKIESYLSSGGFGNTYLAKNIEFDETYAIKEFFVKGVCQRDGNSTTISVSNAENTNSFEQQREKFKKEARRLRSLSNPHIVKVYDLFEENGTAYYVMDYVDGENLSARLKRTNAPLAESEVRNYLNQILDGLEAIHNEGMFHLDIKPANIMVDSHDVVKLIDFGASKQQSTVGGATMSTGISYTNGYAPSEQMAQSYDKFGPWTDFYALGATVYKLLTNQDPPSVSDLSEDDTEDKHLALPMPNVSEEMKKLVVWMMQVNRLKRPKNVREVIMELQEVSFSGGNSACLNSKLQSTLTPKGDEQTISCPNDNIVDGLLQKDVSEKHSIFCFQGRTGRLVYWIVTVLGIVALGLFVFVSEELVRNLGLTLNENVVSICIVSWYLFYCYLVFAVGAKRCHDLGHSGWFQMIPFYGFVMLFLAGNEEENEYGERGNGISNKSIKVLGGIVGTVCVITLAIFLLGEDKAKLYGEAEDIIEGHVIENGIIQPCDSVKALPTIQKLAEKQYGPAMWMLAQYYEHGSAGIAMDTIEANRLCEQAFPILLKEAEGGDMYSQCALSLIYASGKGTQTDNSKAFTWMQKSAEQGYGDALGNLAIHYLNGIGCNENKQKAFECVQKAVEVNKPNGELLAAMYLQGIGTKIDTAKAISIYKELADMQSSSSQAQLGHIYYEQDKYELAFKYLSQAEKKDELQAIDDLTVMYLRGWGVTESQDQAISLAQRSVKLSNRDPYFLFALGVCYEEKDNAKAFANVKESAEKGNPSAQYRLALYYQNGYGVKVNENLAYKWYKKALANGYKEDN